MEDKGKSEQVTLGQAIDQIVKALTALDESSRAIAVDAACSHLGVKSSAPAPAKSPVSLVPASASGAPPRQKDVRTLKENKAPGSAIEMAAVIAFYLQELAPEDQRKPTVTSDDMDKYFKQAGFPLPKYLKDLLPSARRAGYFDQAGYGSYRLNPVGYNLVAHALPRGEPTKTPKKLRSRKGAVRRKRQ